MIKDKKPLPKIRVTPPDIHFFLNQHVISQEKAKKVLSVAVYNHYKRIQTNKVDKSNILLVGPTGVGKTLLVQSIASFLKVPLFIANATSFTEAGYVGNDVEDILFELLQTANFDVEQAEKGIVYIDEFDKLACKDSSSRDVSGKGVQQSLLKILEGTKVSLEREGTEIDTKNILFICGGSFSGIESISSRRMKGSTIGFNQNPVSEESQIVPQDLIDFGLIPECVGRLPIIIPFNKLTQKDLVDILTKPVNSLIKQYQELMKLDGVELEFQKDAINAISEQALSLKTGARGLRNILEEILLNVMYDIPSSQEKRKYIITKRSVLEKGTPVLIHSSRKKAVSG